MQRTLNEHKGHSANNRDGIERQKDEILDQSGWGKSVEGFAGELPEFSDRTLSAPGFDFATLGD